MNRINFSGANYVVPTAESAYQESKKSEIGKYQNNYDMLLEHIGDQIINAMKNGLYRVEIKLTEKPFCGIVFEKELLDNVIESLESNGYSAFVENDYCDTDAKAKGIIISWRKTANK